MSADHVLCPGRAPGQLLMSVHSNKSTSWGCMRSVLAQGFCQERWYEIPRIICIDHTMLLVHRSHYFHYSWNVLLSCRSSIMMCLWNYQGNLALMPHVSFTIKSTFSIHTYAVRGLPLSILINQHITNLWLTFSFISALKRNTLCTAVYCTFVLTHNSRQKRCKLRVLEQLELYK